MSDPNAAPAQPGTPPSDGTNPAAGTPPPAPASGTPPAAPGTPAAAAAPAAPPSDPPAAAGDKPTESGWSADWRTKLARNDDKTLKRLERYASPEAVVDALIAAQNRISSGELKKPLAQNATPEEVAEWRKENGIPEKPEAYLEKLPDGLVIGEDDKPIFEDIAKELHGLNADPKVMHTLAKWYYARVEAESAALAETDQRVMQETEELLRAEWGQDYRVNTNAIKNWIGQAPKEVQEALHSARLPDGTPLIGRADIARWMVAQAREINPIATLVPTGAGNAMQSIEAEIAEIEKSMRMNRSEYNKDERKQARYRELLTAQEKLKAKSAA